MCSTTSSKTLLSFYDREREIDWNIAPIMRSALEKIEINGN